jgi:hypothetical protein
MYILTKKGQELWVLYLLIFTYLKKGMTVLKPQVTPQRKNPPDGVKLVMR